MTGKQTAGEPKHKKDLTRRKVVAVGAGAAAAVGIGGGFALNASADESATGASAGGGSAETCYRLTSETTEGPYYIDADKIRRDITEDKEGIPLTLSLKVIDSGTCAPVRNAAVDVWHCDALGIYSGYEEPVDRRRQRPDRRALGHADRHSDGRAAVRRHRRWRP